MNQAEAKKYRESLSNEDLMIRLKFKRISIFSFIFLLLTNNMKETCTLAFKKGISPVYYSYIKGKKTLYKGTTKKTKDPIYIIILKHKIYKKVVTKY